VKEDDVKGFRCGDVVNYHDVIGGPITSQNHIIKTLMPEPNNFCEPVAWITNKSGCVSLDSLSKAE